MTGMIGAERMPDIHEAIWTPAGGGEARVPFALSSPTPEAVLFTGFGETNVDQIAKYLGDKGLKLAVTNLQLPSNGRRTDPEVYRRSIVDGVEAVRLAVLQVAGYSSGKKLGAAGISQGGGKAIVGVGANLEGWEWVMLASALGATRQEPEDIKDRLLKNGQGRNLPEGLSWSALGRDYGAGMVLLKNSDGPGEIIGLSEKKPTVLIVAGNDQVILADQTEQLLADKVQVKRVDGVSHFSCHETEIENVPTMYRVGRSALDAQLVA